MFTKSSEATIFIVVSDVDHLLTLICGPLIDAETPRCGPLTDPTTSKNGPFCVFLHSTLIMDFKHLWYTNKTELFCPPQKAPSPLTKAHSDHQAATIKTRHGNLDRNSAKFGQNRFVEIWGSNFHKPFYTGHFVKDC